MLEFLHGSDLAREMNSLLKENEGVRAAVAFIGEGTRKRIANKRASRIICDFDSFGTNPQEVKKLLDGGVVIKHLFSLHAKIIIGKNSCIISSANLSTNGMGLEGESHPVNYEAGVLTDEIEEKASEWFEKIWVEAKQISLSDEEWEARIMRYKKEKKKVKTNTKVLPIHKFVLEGDLTGVLFGFWSEDSDIKKKDVIACLKNRGDNDIIRSFSEYDWYEEFVSPMEVSQVYDNSRCCILLKGQFADRGNKELIRIIDNDVRVCEFVKTIVSNETTISLFKKAEYISLPFSKTEGSKSLTKMLKESLKNPKHRRTWQQFFHRSEWRSQIVRATDLKKLLSTP